MLIALTLNNDLLYLLKTNISIVGWETFKFD